MNCPSCGSAAAEGASECPNCGIIFAKWKKLQERKQLEPAAAPAADAVPAADAAPRFRMPDRRTGRIIAGAAVAAWIVGLTLYYRHRLAEVKPPKGEPTGEFVDVRDPATGEMRHMPIRVLVPPPSAPSAPAAPAPAAAAEPPAGESPVLFVPAEAPGNSPPLPLPPPPRR